MNDAPIEPKPMMSGPALAAALRTTAAGPDGLWLPSTGSSMGRAISSGVEVHVSATRPRPVRGEVWAFCTPRGRVMVHRCVSAEEPFQFRGDAMVEPDAPVASDLLVGRVDRQRTRTGERSIPSTVDRKDALVTAMFRVRFNVGRFARKARRAARPGVASRRWKHPRAPKPN